MELGLLKERKDFVSGCCKAKGKQEGVWYLGIRVSLKLTHVYLLDNNIILGINWMQSQLDKWSSFRLWWMSRITVIKMKILPKLFFLFQNLIVFLPQFFLNGIQNIIHNFVWDWGKPRVKASIFQLKPRCAGLSMLAVAGYYYSAVFY